MIELSLPREALSIDHLEGIKDVLYRYPGPSSVVFKVETDPGKRTVIAAHPRYNVFACREMIQELETLIGRKVVCRYGEKIRTIASLSTRSFTAYLDEVLLQNNQMSQRMRIDHPEASAIIPFLSDKEILIVRQYRYALGRETLEIPAGKLDPGKVLISAFEESCWKRQGTKRGKSNGSTPTLQPWATPMN